MLRLSLALGVSCLTAVTVAWSGPIGSPARAAQVNNEVRQVTASLWLFAYIVERVKPSDRLETVNITEKGPDAAPTCILRRFQPGSRPMESGFFRLFGRDLRACPVLRVARGGGRGVVIRSSSVSSSRPMASAVTTSRGGWLRQVEVYGYDGNIYNRKVIGTDARIRSRLDSRSKAVSNFPVRSSLSEQAP